MKKDTSWGGVADWYNTLLEEEKDTYQAQVIAPNLLRLLKLEPDMAVLDLACGQGFFSRLFKQAGATVTGVDIAPELIAIAKQKSPEITWHVAPAENISMLPDASFQAITIVLAAQNIADLRTAFTECARVLKPNGKLLFVLNHPAFRVPQFSSWGFDEAAMAQYRRVDRYLSESKSEISMHPGVAPSETTVSFHRSLQWYMKALRGAGFAMTGMEEWISHKVSDSGPRKDAENRARKEIPLFLCVEASKLH